MLSYATPVANIVTGLSDASTGIPAMVATTVPIILIFTGVALFYRFISHARGGI